MSVTVAAAVGAVKALDLIDDVADWSHMGFEAIDSVAPGIRESCEGHGENVVSRMCHEVMGGYNGLTDMVAGVRDTAGGAIHDAVSSIPLVGGALGGVTDAAGFVVDAVGGTASRLQQKIGRFVGDTSNLVGAALFKADYVDFDDIEALQDVTDAERDSLSQSDIVRKEGGFDYLWNSVFHVGGKALGLDGDGSVPEGGEAAVEDMPEWATRLDNVYANGGISEEQYNGVLAGYATGMYTDEDLGSYVDQCDSEGHAVDWGSLGDSTSSVLSDNGISVDAVIAETMSAYESGVEGVSESLDSSSGAVASDELEMS